VFPVTIVPRGLLLIFFVEVDLQEIGGLIAEIKRTLLGGTFFFVFPGRVRALLFSRSTAGFSAQAVVFWIVSYFVSNANLFYKGGSKLARLWLFGQVCSDF
jgi:hypothetical protein